LQYLANLGITVFTSGEHIYDKVEVAGAADLQRPNSGDSLFNDFPRLLRPANFEIQGPGRGEVIVETNQGKVLVISLIGQVFFRYQNLSPWTYLPEILERYKKENLAGIIIDFHAEATSEKVALFRHFDGQVSAILGTHTHIPTADAQISEKGTAYVTDVGMNGPADSVIGMKTEVSLERFLTGKYTSYDIAESDSVCLNYIELTLDSETGKALKIDHYHPIVDLK